MASAICGSTAARVLSGVFLLDKRICGHCLIFYELQEHWKRPLKSVAAAFVGLPSQAYRIGHVRRPGLELSQEMDLLSGLRKKQFDQALVIARHCEDMRGLPDEFLRDGLTAETRQVDAVSG